MFEGWTLLADVVKLTVECLTVWRLFKNNFPALAAKP